MTKTEKKMKKYLKNVRRKLNLPSDVKKRVMTDFVSSIESRREAGNTDEAIYAELGDPRDAAAVLNEQMKEFAYVKSPWRWLCFAVMLLCVLLLLYKGMDGLLVALTAWAVFGRSNDAIGIIGGADGPTQIFVTRSPDTTAYTTGMTAVILVMSVVGFYYLGHMRKK